MIGALIFDCDLKTKNKSLKTEQKLSTLEFIHRKNIQFGPQRPQNFIIQSKQKIPFCK